MVYLLYLNRNKCHSRGFILGFSLLKNHQPVHLSLAYDLFCITFIYLFIIKFIRATLVQSSMIYDFMFYCGSFAFLKALSIHRKLLVILASICSLK